MLRFVVPARIGEGNNLFRITVLVGVEYQQTIVGEVLADLRCQFLKCGCIGNSSRTGADDDQQVVVVYLCREH